MITIVDYGLGNLASIKNMLKRIGCPSIITGDLAQIENAGKLILPGVGAFDNGMTNIEQRGLLPVLNKKALNDKIPVLGICLGMQLLTNKSEEGIKPGLGWIDAECKKFQLKDISDKLKIPHMGWNDVQPRSTSTIFKNYQDEISFYFVHSYHVICKNDSDILGTTSYGRDFTSAVQKDNIMGVQFHPEKSHKFGMQLLKNFCDL
jgi:glutamine amidotransferase